MSDLLIRKINDVHIKIFCEPGVGKQLSDALTFDVPGSKFHPLVRNRVWDGKIRMFNTMTGLVYAGLQPRIIEWATANDYDCEIEEEEVIAPLDLIATLKKIPCTKEVRDYQLTAVIHAIQERRALLLSPTSSGKSLIAYLISSYHNYLGRKVLIVVPTVNLVTQMATDFYDYFGMKFPVKMITGGVDKENITEEITVTTWQSIYKMPKKWFDQFQVVIGDEAHNFKSKSLSAIMEKLTGCPDRIGMTGTLDGSKTHQLVLEGLFGSVFKVTDTKTLMDQGHVSQLKIKAVVLNYPEPICALMKKAKYPEEISFLVSYEPRNQFLINLTASLEGNTLLLFGIIEHGKHLFDLASSRFQGREIHLVYGATDGEIRDNVRAIAERSENAIIIASYGTFSTGVNIKRLHNVIFTHPTKSRIRTLQSIGRGLRLHGEKEVATLYDIADNLKYKSHENYTIQHFRERIKYYDDERFQWKLHTYKLG